MKITYDFEIMPSDAEVHMIAESLKAVEDDDFAFAVNIAGKGMTVKMDKNAVSSCKDIGIDGIAELLQAMLNEIEAEAKRS
jgi:hypothetical protein